MAENEHDEHHEFDLAVSREDGDTVHEGTYLVALGAFREVYNLERADPDGIERFRVAATMDDQTADDVLETSECYGPVLVNIDESGELFVGTVVC